jgi:hypothetical protein
VSRYGSRHAESKPSQENSSESLTGYALAFVTIDAGVLYQQHMARLCFFQQACNTIQTDIFLKARYNLLQGAVRN